MSKILKRAGALLGHRCPRCYEGDLFPTRTFSFRKPFEMHPACNSCGQSFFPEPGFYYGAMFMSYIITSFFSLGFVGLCILVFGLSVDLSFLLLVLVLGVFFIWFFRTARSTWIHMTVKHDEEAVRKFRESGGVQGGLPDYVNRNF